MKNKITIAEPCTESWEKMAQTGKTDCAFCQSCQKEVIDFTQKSDREIIRIMNSQKNVCGKFTQNQLDKTYQTSESFTVPYKWAMASLFSGLMLTQPAFSQSKKEKTPAIKTVSKFTSSESRNKIEPKIERKDSTNTRTVSGVVRDDTGEVLPGTTVTIKGTIKGVVCDIDGKYSIDVRQEDILIFEFIGFESQEIVVGNQNILDITLQFDSQLTEQLAGIVGGAFFYPKPLSPKWFWHKIKRFPRWITSPFRKKH
ncbi:MAG: hypothetical protein ACJAWV_000899 [Flammeovirgaceae bacterium]|jgi:hypothetical protein